MGSSLRFVLARRAIGVCAAGWLATAMPARAADPLVNARVDVRYCAIGGSFRGGRQRSGAGILSPFFIAAAAGKRRRAKGSPFELVWRLVKRIPRGRVATYGQLADLIEHRLSPVGIGWAIRAAPEEAIPWHRVVNSQGGISTDREHPGLQRAMLETEGVVFDADGHIDLARAQWRPRSGS